MLFNNPGKKFLVNWRCCNIPVDGRNYDQIRSVDLINAYMWMDGKKAAVNLILKKACFMK
jgi:hypothetical protein